MNKKLLLLTIMAFAAIPVFASVTVPQTTESEYVIDNGFSAVTAEMIQRGKANALAVPYISDEEIRMEEMPALQRVLVKFQKYFDPAADSDQFMNHDIRKTPDINDL
jgi:hypothetical protein